MYSPNTFFYAKFELLYEMLSDFWYVKTLIEAIVY